MNNKIEEMKYSLQEWSAPEKKSKNDLNYRILTTIMGIVWVFYYKKIMLLFLDVWYSSISPLMAKEKDFITDLAIEAHDAGVRFLESDMLDFGIKVMLFVCILKLLFLIYEWCLERK